MIAIGLCPHANEPLGSAFAETVSAYNGELSGLALLGPIDPPPLRHQFPLPCDIVTYAARGYLQPLPEQAEFAHTASPATPAQRRAAEFRKLIADVSPDVVVLLHNDVGATAPYLYANRVWLHAEERLAARTAGAYPPFRDIEADWTCRLSERTYAYFPAERIGVPASESAGLFIERDTGVPTLTLELPMFRWSGVADSARIRILDAIGDWVARGAAASGSRDWLVSEVSRAAEGQHIEMVPPATSALAVWSLLQGLVEEVAMRPRSVSSASREGG